MPDFSNYLFRASAIHKLMTEPQSKADKKAGKLSKTTITHLREIHREVKYGRVNEFTSKYTEKGKLQEEAAITLYCRIKKEFYRKNTERLNNDFITGEPDIFKGQTLLNCEHGVDVKCSWSLKTFPYKEDKLSANYEWQNHSYNFLSHSPKWTTAFCLVNAPANLILNEKKNIWYKMDMPSDNDPLYLKQCIEIEKELIFDIGEFFEDNPHFDLHCQNWTYDIPLNDRLIEYETLRDEESIDKIKKVVPAARKHLNTLK